MFSWVLFNVMLSFPLISRFCYVNISTGSNSSRIYLTISSKILPMMFIYEVWTMSWLVLYLVGNNRMYDYIFSIDPKCVKRIFCLNACLEKRLNLRSSHQNNADSWSWHSGRHIQNNSSFSRPLSTKNHVRRSQ